MIRLRRLAGILPAGSESGQQAERIDPLGLLQKQPDPFLQTATGR